MKMRILQFGLSLLIAAAVVTFNVMCAKTAPRPPALLSASGCVDSSGVYTPAILSQFNTVVGPGSDAHFIRVCNEVFVNGTFIINGPPGNVNLFCQVEISLPVVSDLSVMPWNAYGIAAVYQSGAAQPITGAVTQTGTAGQLLVKWQPTQPHNSRVNYSFSYTIK